MPQSIELLNFKGNLVDKIVKFPHLTDEGTGCSDFADPEMTLGLEFRSALPASGFLRYGEIGENHCLWKEN